jgi:hypothetical protein
MKLENKFHIWLVYMKNESDKQLATSTSNNDPANSSCDQVISE